MPHVQDLPLATDQMSREEVSTLGSARREEVRRQIENSEKLKANPLLYLVSPQVKVSGTRSNRAISTGQPATAAAASHETYPVVLAL